MQYFDFSAIAISTSAISKLFWEDFVRSYQPVQYALAAGTTKLAKFSNFSAEVFHRLYYDPECNWLDPIAPENQWAVQLHSEFSNLPECDRLLQQCEGNPLASGIAATEFLSELSKSLPTPPIPDIQGMRDEVKRLKNRRSGDPNLSEAEKENLEEAIAQLIASGKKAVTDAIAFAESLSDSPEARSALRKAADAASAKAEETQTQMEGLGISWGAERSEPVRMPIEEKIKIASQLLSNAHIQKIMRMAGRLREVAARKRRQKQTEGIGELAGIETGNDLARLMPGELVKLAHPTLKPLFYKGYHDRTLLQYEIKGNNPQRGPIVLCIDSSGSMSGNPELWAKAVAITFAEIAREDRRDFRAIHFAESVKAVHDFPVDKQDPKQLFGLIGSFFGGGGTDFEAPLEAALVAIENRPELKKADLFFITDGEADVTKRFLENFQAKQAELEFSVFGILIGIPNEGILRQFCDAGILRLDPRKDLEDPAAIESLF